MNPTEQKKMNDLKVDINRSLRQAAANNAYQEVIVLLAEGADVNAKDIANRTPLHTAAKTNAFETVVLLLAHGADVKANATPLHVAAKENHLETVRVLLEHGADANAKTGDDKTPLHHLAVGKKKNSDGLVQDCGGIPRTRRKCQYKR